MFHAAISGRRSPAMLEFPAMSASGPVYQVVVPSPLYRHFDYLAPAGDAILRPGTRVRVSFGRRTITGVVVGRTDSSEIAPGRLKRIAGVLDDVPLWPEKLLSLLAWVADYYHHPVGEVFATALPVWLRQSHRAEIRGLPVWHLTNKGHTADPAALKRSPAQQQVWRTLAPAADGLDAGALAACSARWRAAVRALEKRGWVERRESPPLFRNRAQPQPGPALNADQQRALDAVLDQGRGAGTFLLHGITGSGKTEVYLSLIARVVADGGQALVLVPEIGLTPQLVARFEQRLGVRVALLHSALPEAERAQTWLAAAAGLAPVIIGTRSAVFVPLPKLAIVIVDEEHDPSFKQQDGLRYSARDVALVRAAREQIPVVLGSATPALESLRHAREGKYRLLNLPVRTGSAALPDVVRLDMRRLAVADGLSAPLREAIAARLQRGEQSLIFLNRRGFAPAWMCHACGWVATCPRCDARLTYHRGRNRLLCHHCSTDQPVMTRCPGCAGEALRPLGAGTERLETALAKTFPKARLVRIDRDSTRRRGALEASLASIHAGEADILVGTQMLAKGHDFPNVTLVGIVNADQGLYAPDFRAEERLMQTILQVSGRAGRADKPGQVLIQTWHPEHPLFDALVRHDYEGFADYLLHERQAQQYPPYAHLALLRAESPASSAPLQFLKLARQLADSPENVTLFDPLPAPMERRAGRYRAQLLVQATERKPLHRFLDGWVRTLSETREARRVRWSLDVDPIDLA